VSPSPPIPRERKLAGRYHQLLWPESCPVSSSTNQELSGKARIETVSKPSQVYGPFRPVSRRSYPQRVMVATVLTRTQSRFLAGQPPPKGPARYIRAGRVKETGRRGVSGPGKVRQPPQIGRREKRVTLLQKQKQPAR
jgi:hypothetical protein